MVSRYLIVAAKLVNVGLYFVTKFVFEVEWCRFACGTAFFKLNCVNCPCSIKVLAAKDSISNEKPLDQIVFFFQDTQSCREASSSKAGKEKQLCFGGHAHHKHKFNWITEFTNIFLCRFAENASTPICVYPRSTAIRASICKNGVSFSVDSVVFTNFVSAALLKN